MIEETLKAWMAGFVDGEGCLTISKYARKERPSPSWRVSITITNTNKPSLEIFNEVYGGVLRFDEERRVNEKGLKWSDKWTWYCPISSVRSFCNDLLPYLVIKKQNALIILDFINHLKNTERSKGGRNSDGTFKGSGPLDTKDLITREEFRNKIQNLNARKRLELLNK